jgi:O-antigen/teichoic acid export membrane protein
MMLGQGLSFVTQALSFVMLARMLGSVQYGIFAGAFAFVSLASPYSSLGSGFSFIRNVSPDPHLFKPYWGNIILSHLFMGVPIVIALSALSWYTIDPASATIVPFIAIGECICTKMLECSAQVFQALEQLRITATMKTLVSLFRLMLISVLFVTLRTLTVKTWVLASLGISFFALLVALITVTKLQGAPEFNFRLFRRRLPEGLGFSVSASSISVYNDVDKTVLSHFGMRAATGIYTMAYKVVDICSVPIYAVYDASLPRFFKLGRVGGVRDTKPLSTRVLKRNLVFGLVMASGMYIFAPLIPRFVGNSFAPSVGALRWLCLIPLFRGCHQSAGGALTGAGYHKFRTGAQLSVGAINFCMNMYLVPKYSWVGAAWASLFTDGFLAVANWSLLGFFVARSAAANKQETTPHTIFS